MRRGFTMIELAVVITLLAAVVPLALLCVRNYTLDEEYAAFQLEVADATRLVSEELRVDLRNGRLADGDGLRLEGPGPCLPITWTVRDGALVREAPEACGGARTLARRVTGLTRGPGGIDLVFSFAALGSETRTTRVTLGLGARP